MRIASLLLVVPALLLLGCGDTGPSGDPGGEEAGGGGGTPNPGPQVALILSNGHSPLLPDYLSAGTGPQLETAIENAGFTVETSYFTDGPTSYTAFVEKLRAIRDEWITDRQDPTRVVIVGHSHGCVRTHAAIRAVPDCAVELLVDLDGSSVGWSNVLTHLGENALIGGAPEGAYDLGVQLTRASVGSAGGAHDLEDVVFPNVSKCYEVRSGDMILNPQNPLQLIEYDERWNARTDGTTAGLTCVFSNTPHAETAAAGGTTINGVQAWIVAELLGP